MASINDFSKEQMSKAILINGDKEYNPNYEILLWPCYRKKTDGIRYMVICNRFKRGEMLPFSEWKREDIKDSYRNMVLKACERFTGEIWIDDEKVRCAL